MWDLCGQDSKSLDYSSKSGSGNATQSSLRPDFLPDQSQVWINIHLSLYQFN